jgi:hypothetical protein
MNDGKVSSDYTYIWYEVNFEFKMLQETNQLKNYYARFYKKERFLAEGYIFDTLYCHTLSSVVSRDSVHTGFL